VLSVGAVASVLERHVEAVPIKTAVAAMRTVSLNALAEAAAAPAVSAPAMALAKGALQAMFMTQLKVGAALALVCGVLATGAGLAVQRALEDKGPLTVQDNRFQVPPRPTETQKVGAAQQVRTDSNGNPLPIGALARLGTLQLRH
jgi:hypothetical protein